MFNSCNEWDPLKEVILGTATNAHWPVACPIFRNLEKTTLWTETPVPKGAVEQHIIDESNYDLEVFSKVLTSLGIKVYRPNDMQFANFDGMYNYCPRDRVLVVGDTAIDAPMLYPTRKKELEAIRSVLPNKVISCSNFGATFDAANICRLGNDLLYLISESGNRKGAEWLQSILPDHKIHILENVYSGVHIDSTIVPVREGLVVLNADRINEKNIPQPIKDWDKIWISGNEIVPQGFFKYPYASKYIALNFLTVNPNLVICDPYQTYLRSELGKRNVDSIGVELRHSRTLGGGHHCVTLDLYRHG